MIEEETNENPFNYLLNHEGTIEDPADWSVEYDHYLYGTLKIEHLMNKRVFVDTSFIIAILNTRDQYNNIAQKLVKDLQLILTPYLIANSKE